MGYSDFILSPNNASIFTPNSEYMFFIVEKKEERDVYMWVYECAQRPGGIPGAEHRLWATQWGSGCASALQALNGCVISSALNSYFLQ